jgi:hypothetical protein
MPEVAVAVSSNVPGQRVFAGSAPWLGWWVQSTPPVAQAQQTAQDSKPGAVLAEFSPSTVSLVRPGIQRHGLYIPG